MDRHPTSAGRWQLAARAQRMQPSALRELLKVAERPDIISFAGGLPSPCALPVERLQAAVQRILQRDAVAALQYGPSEGYLPLRETIAERLSKRGAAVSPSQVLVTTGSQQGLDLVARILVDPGSSVLIETPTYLGAVQALAQYEPVFEEVPADAAGLLPERLTEASMRRARLLYTQPNFQNPTGRTLAPERRIALVSRATRHGLLLVEDDPYGELVYSGVTPASLLSMAPGSVVHLGSFSKVVAPGLRVGYLVAPEALMGKLLQAKQASDLHTTGITQRLVHALLNDGEYDAHLDAIRRRYRAQCALMLSCLAEHMPDGVTWSRPTGGMFLWVTLPAEIDSTLLFEDALARGVAFIPGASFHAVAPKANTLRLTFTTATPSQIESGIARLAQAIRARLRPTEPHRPVAPPARERIDRSAVLQAQA
ncbi:PLP-dependent aminotransferase family protein [Pandoraea terrigena]|uniref:2-aminoadipate aminotransferase n=1 Tax=Pandoraea terrigena TaxID=2508292 RepID=A0A5E4SR11_9BURK|nr:PLP-dependent aminotransferase family protein [Pandoraea terrigena]VVD77551.1 2-aminoadipate aminotransferase [Pandoraea terrigena]